MTPTFAQYHESQRAATIAGWRYRGVGPKFFYCGQPPRYLRSAIDAWVAAG